MSITKFYGGFNPAWRAGRLERDIVDAIAIQLVEQFPKKNCIVAVPSWHEPVELAQDICNLNPDVTVICSLSDPFGPMENLLDKIPGRVIPLGYVDKGIKFDFWAFACEKYFKKYKNTELYPSNLKNVYLNYNRKPHRHRTEFIKLLELYDLIQYGIVSLGDSKYSVNDRNEDYIEYGSNDVVGDVGIPNDVYSLGRLDIWNSCFLNIVSETQFELSSNVFVSEKIYKPILGLRPFIVNGSPGIYRWLKNIGFDCFEDIFPVEQLLVEFHQPGLKFQTQQNIISCIKNLLNEDLAKLYNDLMPRLLYNQKLFYEHANNQRLNFQF